MDPKTKKQFQRWGKAGGLARRKLSKRKRSEIAAKGWRTRRRNRGADTRPS